MVEVVPKMPEAKPAPAVPAKDPPPKPAAIAMPEQAPAKPAPVAKAIPEVAPAKPAPVAKAMPEIAVAQAYLVKAAPVPLFMHAKHAAHL